MEGDFVFFSDKKNRIFRKAFSDGLNSFMKSKFGKT